MPRRSTPEDFWKHVMRSNVSDCWLWMGARDEHGYGRVRYHGREWAAHRLAWAFTNLGPDEMSVLHRCDNPPCCNPAHLFLGNQKDNMADSAKKGRHPRNKAKYLPSGDNHHSRKTPEVMARGEKNGAAILTESKVRKIRKLAAAGVTHRKLAQRFGVSKSTVTFILQRHTWRHVK